MPKDRTTADVKVLFDRGHESIQSQDYREAIECFSRVIALRPDVPAGYRYRARAYLELGQRTDALNDLDRAIRLKSDDPALFAERAEILHRQKAYEAAIADCDKVLSLDSGWTAIHGLRGECYTALGDSTKAMADFALAINGDPDHAAQYYLSRANLQLDCENFNACIADCNAALRIDSELASAFRTRGLAYRELGDLVAAEKDLSEALRLEPDSALAALARATVRFDMGESSQAIQDCDIVLTQSPNTARAFTIRGMCKRRLNDLSGALADYTEAIRNSPDHAPTYNLRAAVYYQQSQFGRAIQDHLDALKRDPRNPATFNQLGWIWATAPDPDVRNGRQAKECATRACELSEWQEPGFLDTLAAAFAECGEFEEAVKWQEKARDLAKPEQAEDYGSRVMLYLKGRPHRARPTTE